jgi:hypothetical protein
MKMQQWTVGILLFDQQFPQIQVQRTESLSMRDQLLQRPR